ncbi:Dihem cytochrome c [Desulfobulbus propionicus DSM 2032]|uniref:Dihem cytochrome c n=1 Tax=Desulfobulbus propionicus (strain ATCC 33891 / DSM 2032 / VKM B-1956 / 1pr3) TaxID=577650 RepID=A0A7U3YMM1_DESPD|nr:diheme cytochrome c [Desulfobulbus propionicus]ADW18145.1 Dihem cytochrome c [Desulfobulbus propionicus DSM 2032]
MKKHNTVNMLLTSYLLFLFPCCVVASEHKQNETRHFDPVTNGIFKQTCGACHFAYQPGLLPSGSWEKILSNLPSHFGEEITLEEKSKNLINEYVRANSAEYSSAKRAKKILKSLAGQTPLRITEIPYIREKHRELDANIFSKPSIGSRSNCIACHSAAEQGNYDDDFVKIPN